MWNLGVLNGSKNKIRVLYNAIHRVYNIVYYVFKRLGKKIVNYAIENIKT